MSKLALKQTEKSCGSYPAYDLHADLLLTRDEVEKVYGITKRFLELAACTGNGPPFVKIGRRCMYLVRDLNDFIQANRFDSTSQVDQRKKVGG